jgi:putative ABC transport system substrate-binding protein
MVPDPVGQGFAASLARPGTNITGRSSQHFELVPILQLFHEAVPEARRIAVLANALNPFHQGAWSEAQAAAQSLNVDLMRVKMQGAAGVDAALESVAKSNANALFILPDDPATYNLRPRIIAYARERALPLLAPYREVVEDGALMSYGESSDVQGNRSLPRQDRQWCKACRATDHAADSLRADSEPEGSERTGHHDSAFSADTGGSGD